MTIDLKKLKKPESKNILTEKPKPGNRTGTGMGLTAHIRLGLTSFEKDQIVKLACQRGISQSQIVRMLLREGGHI